jgi:hypothetical protein
MQESTHNTHFAKSAKKSCVPFFVGWVSVIGLGVAGWLGWERGDEFRYFLHSYLVSYCYFLSISLGALFFVALQHATRAGWSVTVRRLAELLAANMPVLTILFLPILVPVLLGNPGLYVWADASAVAADPLLQHKAAYLNAEFFAARAVFYFIVWGWSARFFLLKSTEQDESANPRLTEQMERFSPVALLLFAVTVTFAAFDWLMSLEPTWFSTIFGLYYFSGAALGFIATVILMAMWLQASGRIGSQITTEHYHDLGKFLLTFVVFWGYIAFSQYMLIWYANIPEETVWYLARQTGGWMWVSVVLLFGQLLIPFFGLISRWAKRWKFSLGFWAAWLMVMHWIDIYWLVMPNCSPENPSFGLIDVACIVGIGGLYLAGLLWTSRRRSLVPIGDPRLEESLEFENE